MDINQKLCPAGLKNNPNKPLASISYITIHCTGNYNATAGAKNHAEYLYAGSGGSTMSWHYSVDGDSIWQSFRDDQACWHAGDGSGGPGNSTSIGIEICVNSKSVFPRACANAAWLAARLLKKHGLTIDKVVQHYRWSGKDCPMEIRSGSWGVTWDGFITEVKEQLVMLAAPAPVQPVAPPEPPKSDPNIVKAPDPNEPSAWARDAWNWAKGLGITDGKRPKANTTREELATILHRYCGHITKAE